MAFFSFSKKAREETVVLFDITSGSVGGALVHFIEGQKPLLLFSLREEMPLQERFNFDRFFVGMIQTLTSVAKEMEGESYRQQRKPRTIVCVFASPWYTSKTKFVHDERAESFTVTQKFLTELAEREWPQGGADGTFDASPAVTEDNALLTERAIIGVKLNGYETREPEGKRATTLDVALFASAVSDEVLERVRTTLAKFFPEARITPASTALITYSLFCDLFPDKKNVLLIRIGSEVSDISLVGGGILLETASFPFGEETLVRTVSKTLNRDALEVRSLIRLERRDETDKRLSLRLKAALMGPERQWTRLFDETLEHFRNEGTVPRDIFVMADSEATGWFVERMESEEYRHHPLTSGLFSVTTTGSGLIKKEVVCAVGVPCDFFLTETALFLDKAFQRRS